MSPKYLLEVRGFTPRHEHGDNAKLVYWMLQSFQRWSALPETIAARRVKLRAAHRRYLRRMGLPFKSVRRSA